MYCIRHSPLLQYIDNLLLSCIKVIKMFSWLFCTGFKMQSICPKIPINKYYLGSWIGIPGLNCYPFYFQLLTLYQTGALRDFPTNKVHINKTHWLQSDRKEVTELLLIIISLEWITTISLHFKGDTCRHLHVHVVPMASLHFN